MLQRAAILVVALMLLDVGSVEAGMLRDHVTNPLNWSGLGVAENSVDEVDKTTVVGVFEGDGGVVSKVGLIMAMADGFGEPTSADPTPFDWYVNFYDSLDAFAANPFSQNDALPETKFFDQPTNVGWQTVVGTSQAGYLLRYIEFDVSAEGWTTTPDLLQGIGVFATRGGHSVPMQTGAALSTGVSAVGQHDDWTAAQFGDDSFGPDTLIDFGYQERFAAVKVETVPEPSSLWIAATGLVLALCWRSLRSKLHR